MPGSNVFQNDPSPEAVRLRLHRPPSFTGMGYRLAAAGPRTRQKLIERESGFPPPDEIRYAQGAMGPALVADRSAAPVAGSSVKLPADLAEERLAPASVLPSRLTVWRAAALLGCSVCGFSMVLFGQSLHLDKALHVSMKAKPGIAVAASAAPEDAAAPVAETSLDARTLAAVGETSEPIALPANLRGVTLAAQSTPAPSAIVQAAHPVEARAPETRFADSRMAEKRQMAPHALAAARPASYALVAPRRVMMAAEAPLPGWRSATRRVAQRDFSLPAWLTKPPSAPQRPQILSPQPRNLDEPEHAAPEHETQLAEQLPPPRPVRHLPPLPQYGAHGPPIIYAEAQYPQQEAQPAPPPQPYYRPAYGYGYGYGYGGYYGYPPYPYPRSSW